MKESFDIIIPTKNEEENIKRLINEIHSQTVQPQLIIVADKSKDNTAQVAKDMGCTIVEGVDDGYIGRGRNNGLKISTSKYIVFMDADAGLPTPDYLEKAFKHFIDSKLYIMTAYMKADKKGYEIAFSVYNAVKRLGAMTKKIISDTGTFMIIDRETLVSLGGFREDLKNSEDIQLITKFINAGYKFDVYKEKYITSTRRIANKSIFTLLGMLGAIIILGIFAKTKLKRNKFIDRLENIYGETGGTVKE